MPSATRSPYASSTASCSASLPFRSWGWGASVRQRWPGSANRDSASIPVAPFPATFESSDNFKRRRKGTKEGEGGGPYDHNTSEGSFCPCLRPHGTGSPWKAGPVPTMSDAPANGKSYTLDRRCCCGVTQAGRTLHDSKDCGLPGSSVLEISWARRLVWVPFPSPGGPPHTGIEPESLPWQAHFYC